MTRKKTTSKTPQKDVLRSINGNKGNNTSNGAKKRITPYKPSKKQLEQALTLFQGVKMTGQQRDWWYAYIDNRGDATKAARIAYPNASERSARTIGYENVRKFKMPLDKLSDLMGLTDVTVLATLQNGLQATKTVIASHEGQITDEREYIDYAARRSYAELILKARGQLTDRTELNITTRDPGDFEGQDAAGYIEKVLLNG